MKLTAALLTFTVLASLVTSPSVHAENYINDTDKAKIVMSHPFLGIEPDGSLNTILAFFERMGYEKTEDKFDEALNQYGYEYTPTDYKKIPSRY